MSKTNYSKAYYNGPKNDRNNSEKAVEVVNTVEPEVVETNVEPVEEKVEKPVEEKVAKPVEEKPVKGAVSNCAKLNIRQNPSTNAAVLCVVNALTEVVINKKESSTNWYKVTLANGVEGYCMKKFITAKK